MGEPKRRARWGIRVVFKDGGVAFLRHGPVTGYGPIVRFSSRKLAEINLDFVRQGLDTGATASIFRILPSLSRQGSDQGERGEERW